VSQQTPQAFEEAWDMAFAAPWEDRRPWWVLADMLSEVGDWRGELMSLQLEAEELGSRGLAKVRLHRLLHEAGPRLQPDSTVVDRVERGVVRRCTTQVQRVNQADHRRDDRWATVYGVDFVGPARPSQEAWRRSVLASGHLRRARRIGGLEREGLVALSTAPALALLEEVELVGEVGRTDGPPASDWQAWWRAVFERHRTLRHVVLGWHATTTVFRQVLDAVAQGPLTRLTLHGSTTDVAMALDFVRAAPRAFEVWVRLRDESLQAQVQVLDGELRVQCPFATGHEAEHALRSNWPSAPMPPITRWG
jgi:hypothetical protein